MKLKKCKACNIYTLNEQCPRCKNKTADAHYKFIKFGSREDLGESE